MNPELLNILQCPRDSSPLRINDDHLCCEHGHTYPVIDGIPVLLLSEKDQTIGIAAASLAAARERKGGPLYLDTVGISAEERASVQKQWAAGTATDPVIAHLIGATSGYGYVDAIGKLKSYPIPDIPIEAGAGRRLLDIGCNWGRWSISAARKGWNVVGIDPSLGALLAAKRVFPEANQNVALVCGDARFLPFKSNVFDSGFSYSVIQHFSEEDAGVALAELGRVLVHGGAAHIQMAHSGGFRARYIQKHSEAMNHGTFRVRYWTLASLKTVFEESIGPTKLVPEAFGGLGLLRDDLTLVSWKAKMLILLSSMLKGLSALFPWLITVSDSVNAIARKR